MFFGSYLVKKNEITAEQALETLVEQVESTSSVLKIIRENNILSDQDTLKVIDAHIESKESLLDTCLSLKVIDSSKADNIRKLVSESRPTYGDLLISKGLKDQESLEKMFTEFLTGDHENEKENAQEGAAISAAALESLKELGMSDSDELKDLEKQAQGEKKSSNDGEIAINSAALESLKELGGIEADELSSLEEKVENKALPLEEKEEASSEGLLMINEFLDSFSQRVYKKCLKIVSMAEAAVSAKSDVGNVLNSLYRELHVIRGSARLANAKITEKLICEWEESIESLFKEDTSIVKKWADENLSSLHDGIEILWMLRNSIKENRSETGLWSDGNFKERYTENIKSAKSCIIK